MRTLYLSLGMLLATGAVAQQIVAPKALSSLQPAMEMENPSPSSPMSGDTVISSDFGTPNDWTLSSEGTSPKGCEWQIGFIDSFQKGYAREVTSPSKDNGYAWCSGISIIFAGQPYNPIRTYLTYNGSFDLSGITNATITYYENYRPFNSDDCFVEFSTDGGTTWVSSQVNTDGKDKMGWFSLVLPAAVCNKPDVKLRFVWTADNNGIYGAGYGWQIDDLSIVKTPNRELAFTDLLFDGGNAATYFFHKQLPLSQAHMYEPIVYVKNNGAVAQNVTVTAEVMKDGVFYGTYSNPTPVAIGVRKDTSFFFNTFKPDAIGHYTVTYAVAGDSPGDIEKNDIDNVLTADFSITDGIYSDNDGIEWKGGSWPAFRESGNAANPFAEVGAVQSFQVWKSGEKAYSVTTVFPSRGDVKFGVGQSLYFDLYKFVNTAEFGSGYNVQKLQNVASKEYEVKAEDTTANGGLPKYIQVDFEEMPDLEPGLYMATITAYGGSLGYNMPTYSGSNRDQSGGIRGVIQSGSNNTDFILYSNINPFIKLNTKPGLVQVGIDKNFASNFRLEQNVPNPFTEFSSIAYTLDEKATVEFMITDITGKVVMHNAPSVKAAGKYTVELNAADYTSGVYFYSLSVNGQKITKKLIVNQ